MLTMCLIVLPYAVGYAFGMPEREKMKRDNWTSKHPGRNLAVVLFIALVVVPLVEGWL